jgi:hypothetical protein
VAVADAVCAPALSMTSAPLPAATPVAVAALSDFPGFDRMTVPTSASASRSASIVMASLPARLPMMAALALPISAMMLAISASASCVVMTTTMSSLSEPGTAVTSTSWSATAA